MKQIFKIFSTTITSFFALLLICSCSHSQKQNLDVGTGSLKVPHKGAVIAGDFPDPSVIRVENVYWAATTTSHWAPAFNLLSSTDLVNWQFRGGVFTTLPAWTDGNYWAPEIAMMKNTFFVYYSAKNKKSQRMCVGVATANAPEGPYEDHGPIVCDRLGSIDPAPIEDSNGKKYLAWKEDGNSQKKPTPIHIQRLSDSGTKLIGKRTTAITNDTPWEANLVEGPYIKKHLGYWYLFYSGAGCCGSTCDYALGVARAKSLDGPWEKNPQNPILKSNADWKCPGHGSVVTNPLGQDVFLYHAYHVNDTIYVGRQAMVDAVDWNTSNWPTINNNNGPSSHIDGFLGAKLQNLEHDFFENFSAENLTPGWQWPYDNKPKYVIDRSEKELVLSSDKISGDPFSAVLARETTSGNYSAIAEINLQKLSKASAGISAYGDENNALGLYVLNSKLHLQTKFSGALKELGSWDLASGEKLYLKLTAHDGHYFQFAFSADGQKWKDLGSPIDCAKMPPWDLGIRIALISNGRGEARFKSFKMIASE